MRRTIQQGKLTWQGVVLAIALAVIAAVPPSIVAMAAFNKASATHELVNSRMTELLEITRKSSKAEGKLGEQNAQGAREEAAAAARPRR